MNKLEKYEQYAKRIPLFKGLEAEEVGQIIKQGRTLEFRKGVTIFHEGQLGSNLFVVLRGEVSIHVHQDVIAKCAVGDAFGEMSVLNHRPHSGSAVAESDVKCFVLDEQHLNELLEQHVAVRLLLNVIHILSSYLERSNLKNHQLRMQAKQLNFNKKQPAGSDS